MATTTGFLTIPNSYLEALKISPAYRIYKIHFIKLYAGELTSKINDKEYKYEVTRRKHKKVKVKIYPREGENFKTAEAKAREILKRKDRHGYKEWQVNDVFCFEPEFIV